MITHPPLQTTEVDQSPPARCGLHVVAIYDGLTCAILVREAFDWLVRQVAPFFPVSHRAWSFSLLSRPDTRAAARNDADEAGMIIVAADGKSGLPSPVADWLDARLGGNLGGVSMLVELDGDFDETRAVEKPLSRELRQLAERWRLDFISGEDFETKLNGTHLRGLGGHPSRFDEMPGTRPEGRREPPRARRSHAMREDFSFSIPTAGAPALRMPCRQQIAPGIPTQ